MMLSRFGIPRLSYAQLFSFQVLYSNNADSRGYANAGTFGLLGRKKGEWKRAILEVDYTMGTLFLQDKDRIIMSESFEEYKRYKAQESSLDDTLVSVRFKSGQWEIMAQNAVEKDTLQHLLQCIVHDLGPQEAAEIGAEKGLVGVNKEVMKYGLVQRRAKTAYKKDERFLLIVPGKLLLFKGMDIVGKHVRFVTSLFGASTRLFYGQLELEVNVPDSKALNLITPTAEELTGWIGAIEKSALFANGALTEPGGKKSREAGADRRRNLANTSQEDRGLAESHSSLRYTRKDNTGGRPRKEAVYTNRSNDYEAGSFQRGGNQQVVEREREQRSQVRDANMENPVELRGLREDFKQSNDRNTMNAAYSQMERSSLSNFEPPRLEQSRDRDQNKALQSNDTNMMTTDYSRMERSSRSNFQPPRLEQSRDRDQNKAFDRGRQNNPRLNTALSIQEVPGMANQSAKPARSPRRDYLDQRTMDNSLTIVESADVRRREGRDFDEVKSQAMVARQEGTASRGQGFVSQNQAGSRGAITDHSPRSARAWEGGHGAFEGYCAAFEDRSTSKGPSSLQRTSVQLSQELPSQASSSNPTELRSKRRSVKELEKLLFYLNLYRKGLVDSATQTD